jgi:GT2 family glycosyltransferase
MPKQESSSKIRKPARKPLRLCIVAVEITSGNSTEKSAAIPAIAQKFASLGDSVTLLWAPRPDHKVNDHEFQQLRQYLSEKFLINLVLLPSSNDLLSGTSSIAKQSVSAYHFLREHEFDAAFFTLDNGLAYFSLLAKETGVFENPPPLYVIASSAMAWASEAEKFFLSNIEQVTAAHMEKYCAEECDGLICLSHAFLDWMRRKEWNITSNCRVIPAPVPYEWRLRDDVAALPAQPSNEIVFCAGQEYRNGLTLLCDALSRIADRLPPDFTLTMLGQFGQILGEHTGGMLVRRGRAWPFELKMLSQISPRERLEYIRDKGALAVFPAYESSGNLWVSACLTEALPFIATSVGDIPELVTQQSRPDCLCEPAAPVLAQKILEAVKGPRPTPIASESFEASQDAWQNVRDHIMTAEPPKRRAPASLPLVSIVVVHHDRPHYLLQALKSIEQQDYERLEVVLVDDGSKLPESKAFLDSLEPQFRQRHWQIIRAENKYLGAARNTGVRAARGTHILFMDDDNALFASAVSTFVHAMNSSGADICTSFHRTFYGDHVPARETTGYVQYITLGASLDLGFIENTFGDANAMMLRSVFDKIGYQVELFGRTGEDWEFFARAALAGLKLRVVPKPTYWYRSSTTGMFRTSHWYDNRLPTLETYRQYGFKGLEHLYHLALSSHIGKWDMMSMRANLSFSPSDESLLELCNLPPESDEALDMLAGIAAAEGRPGTAVILLGQRRNPISFARDVAGRLATPSGVERARSGLSTGLPAETRLDHHELRMLTVSTLNPEETPPLCYVEKNPDRVYLKAGEHAAVATLRAGLPTLTTAISLTASLDQAIAGPTEFLVLVSPTHLEPALAVEQAPSSGWCRLSHPHQSRDIEIQLPTPSSVSMNLILAVRSATQETTTGCFSSILIKRLLTAENANRPRSGAPAERLRARECAPEEFARAELVTAYESPLPLMLLPPEGGIFLRPSVHGPVVATLSEVFPPFARRAIGYAEIAHDEASPFEFAMALTRPGEPIVWRKDAPDNYLEFSGWKRVEDTFQLHEIALENKHITRQPLALSLAIRVPKGSKPAPANAFWRRVIIAWDE